MKKSLLATAAALVCVFSPLAQADLLETLKCKVGNCNGAGFGGSLPVIGNVPGWMSMSNILSQLPGGQGAWVQDYEAGQRAKEAKDWATAEIHMVAALKGIDDYAAQYPGREGLYGIQQRVALATVAHSARAQGRPADAVAPLERLLILEEAEVATRVASGNPGQASMSMGEAMGLLKAAMEVGSAGVAHMNRRWLTTQMEGTPVDELLAERLPRVEMAVVNLTETYTELGMREKAFGVFSDPFKRYLERRRATPNPSPNSNPLARQSIDLDIENACFRMAIALGRFGQSPQADEAFECAIRASSSNYVELGVKNSTGIMHDATAERRRLMVGAYATYVFSSDSPQGRQELMRLVAETKGASNRYRERRRAIWMHTPGARFDQARPQFADHERRLTDMPMLGGNHAVALARWTNEEHALMTTYFADFQKAGLSEVFTPGEQILASSRSELERRGLALGGAEVLIGYSVYRPVDFKTQQLAPSRVLRYVVSKDDVQLQDLGTVSQINQMVRRWRSTTVAGQAAGAGPLSEVLLGKLPIGARTAKSWVIDPDGALSVLPFEALLEPGVGDARVLERRAVRYVTSIAEFSDGVRAADPRATGGNAVIVADPVFSAAGATGGLGREVRTTSGELLRNVQLQPLPETRDEANRVAAALTRMGLTTQVHAGEQATKSAFNFNQAPRFLHVATHGFFLEPGLTLADQSYVRLASALPGMQSALALSDSDGGSILTGADITRLNLLGTELVVFSACDTGNGDIEAGEGVASLRRAVEEAGARSSVTSLWPVPSKATAALMSDFYARLAAGQSKSEALRQAKLTLMKTSPNPLNWAGFLLAGEP